MSKKILGALLLMGFTSLIVQTLVIREFLISFYGNELIIGLLLANWIIWEACGSHVAGRPSHTSSHPRLHYAMLQIGIAVYLPAAIFLIRTVRTLVDVAPGQGIGMLPVFLSSFCILAPLGLFDGAQFPFGCRMLADIEKKPLQSAGRVYILEAMGFILAGPIFTYLFITHLHSFAIAFLVSLCNLLSAISLVRPYPLKAARFLAFAGCLLLAVVTAAFFGPAARLHTVSVNRQWQKPVLHYQNTLYGNLAITQEQEQYTFYSDGLPIITVPSPDVGHIEDLVHFVMLSHPAPRDVLVLSGGAGGVIAEILKYPVRQVTYTEIDPVLIELIAAFPTDLTQRELDDPRLRLIHMDGRRFLRLTKDHYDVILLNLSHPSTLQLNRFYTQEFFRNVKAALREHGIFGFTLPGSLTYVSPPARRLNSSIRDTLSDVFSVTGIPGDSNIYLASRHDIAVTPRLFLQRLQAANIRTELLSKPYLEYRLNPSRIAWLEEILAESRQIRNNFDLLPSGTFYSIAYWNSIFSPAFQPLFETLDRIRFRVVLIGVAAFGGIGFVLLWLVPAAKRSRISAGFAVGSTGFVGMSFDLMLIYAYQSFYGFVFSHLALLVTAFMSGLTLGGWRMTKRLPRIQNPLLTFRGTEGALLIFCALAGGILFYLNRVPSIKFAFILFSLAAISGFLVGSQFPLANAICSRGKASSSTAGILYALDLAGGWLAALTVSIALVPVVGILKTCVLLFALKAMSLGLIHACCRMPVMSISRE